MKVDWLKVNHSGASQIYESGPEFCFISNDKKQCHPFVFCKDFLQDAVHGQLNNRTAKIYGFNYDPQIKPPIDTETTRIAFTNSSDKQFEDKIPNTLDFINQIAKKMKLKETKLIKCVNPPKRYAGCGIFVFEGSSKWMNSPPLLSMFTLLLRIGCVHEKGQDFMTTIDGILSSKIEPYQENDYGQLRQAMPGIKNILEIGYRKFFYIDDKKNFPEKVSTDSMHENCGICSFAQGHSPVEHWNRKAVKDKILSILINAGKKAA